MVRPIKCIKSVFQYNLVSSEWKDVCSEIKLIENSEELSKLIYSVVVQKSRLLHEI